MRQYEQPTQRIIQLHKQPDFPMVDLTADNTEILKYVLVRSQGLDAYTDHIKDGQRLIHQIANRAAMLMGARTRYNPAELRSFSHGFAGFEAISDLVHPPRIYDIAPANSRAALYLVDARDSMDIEAEEMIAGLTDNSNHEESEVLRIDDGEEYAKYRMELTPAMEDVLHDVPIVIVSGGGHTRANPEKIFTEHSQVLPEQLPNTYDVVVRMGEVRGETMSQLWMRVAGAGLARTLQTRD